MSSFFHLTLRTRDVDAALSFCRRVLGDRARDVVKLHEQAVARGARPHWLGYLGVDDVKRTAAAFIERGATSFGQWINPEGLEAAVLRDPGGAFVAVAKSAREYPSPESAWCLLHTSNAERAITDYRDLFDWRFGEAFDLGAHGRFHPFAWDAADVGAMTELRPGVHAQWLFHFAVRDVDLAADEVRASGGVVGDVVTTPDGKRVAICDDPQGATFALMG